MTNLLIIYLIFTSRSPNVSSLMYNAKFTHQLKLAHRAEGGINKNVLLNYSSFVYSSIKRTNIVM